MPVQGVNYAGSKYFPEPVIHGSPVTNQAVVNTQAGISVTGGGAPTVTASAGMGTAATITSQVGTDQAGSFVLTTGTQTPLGGTLLSVVFSAALPLAPASVNVTVANTTAGATTVPAAGALAFSTTGFSVQGAAPAVSSTYLFSYQVLRQT